MKRLEELINSGNIPEIVSFIEEKAALIEDEEIKQRILDNAGKLRDGYEDTVQAAVAVKYGKIGTENFEKFVSGVSKLLSEEQIKLLTEAEAQISEISGVSKELENAHAACMASIINETIGKHPVRDTFLKLNEENLRHNEELKMIFTDFSKNIFANMKIGMEAARQSAMAASAAAIDTGAGAWESIHHTAEKLTTKFKSWGRDIKDGVLKAGMFVKNAINKATFVADVALDSLTLGAYGNFMNYRLTTHAHNASKAGHLEDLFDFKDVGFDEKNYPSSFITKVEKEFKEFFDPNDDINTPARALAWFHDTLSGYGIGALINKSFVNESLPGNYRNNEKPANFEAAIADDAVYWDKVRGASFGLGQSPADKIREFDKDISAKIMEKSEKITGSVVSGYNKGLAFVISGIKSAPLRVGKVMKIIKEGAENFKEMAKQAVLTGKKELLGGFSETLDEFAGFTEKVQRRYARRIDMLEKKKGVAVEKITDIESGKAALAKEISDTLTESTYVSKLDSLKEILKAATPTAEVEDALKLLSEYNAKRKLTHDILSAPGKILHAANTGRELGALKIYEKSLKSDIQKYESRIFGAANTKSAWEKVAGKIHDTADKIRDTAGNEMSRD